MKTHYFNWLIVIVAIVLLNACKKDKIDINETITVKTTEITNIGTTTAETGGVISYNGTEEITDKGICYSETPSPTTTAKNNIIHQGKGKEVFSCNLTGLKEETKYYVRAYAVSSKFTVYGDELSFTTKKDDSRVFVAGGTFLMGSPDDIGLPTEHPQHEVTLNDFYISKYEISNAQFANFLNANGNLLEEGVPYINIQAHLCEIEETDGKFKPKAGKENFPVSFVNWYGAKAYCQWVGGRLPTEAEWEYVARGGCKSKGYIYSGSNTIDDIAWYNNNSENSSHQVGTKQPNELGVYDMSGNQFEWCNDWFSDYNAEAQYNPQGAANGTMKILRGGSWNYISSYCKVAFRSYYKASMGLVNYGFRVAYDKTN